MLYFWDLKNEEEEQEILGNRTLIYLLALAGFLGFTGGCYPYPETSVVKSDLDIVISNYNDKVDFSQYKTYVLFDSVALIIEEDEGADSDDPFYQNGYDQYILDEIKNQMEALGYTRKNVDAFPDLGVAATAFRIVNVEITSIPGWWWGFPGYGWWGPGNTPGYNPGGWYSTFYTYQQGTIVIDMEDLQKAQSDTALVWNSVINGLVDVNTEVTSQRISTAVESAFKQSRNFYPREIK